MPGTNVGSYLKRPVAYFNRRRHRLGRWFAGYPAYSRGNKSGGTEFLSAADCEPVLVRFYPGYVDGFSGGKPQPVPLPHGVKGGSPVLAQHFAFDVDYFSWGWGEALAQKSAVVCGDKANILAAGLAGVW